MVVVPQREADLFQVVLARNFGGVIRCAFRGGYRSGDSDGGKNCKQKNSR
jgi:hypothetical protein